MGRPALLVATQPFVALARDLATSYGAPATRIVEIVHPLGGIDAAAIETRAVAAVESALALLVRG